MGIREFETWLRVLIETACHPQIAYVMTHHEQHVEKRKSRVRPDQVQPGLAVTLHDGTEILIDLR